MAQFHDTSWVWQSTQTILVRSSPCNQTATQSPDPLTSEPPMSGDLVIEWQFDCRGKTEPILFGCPAIPRRYHGIAPSQVLLCGRGRAEPDLCRRTPAHVTAAFIQTDQAVGKRSRRRAVRAKPPRTASDTHRAVLPAACHPDTGEGGRHPGVHATHGAKQAHHVRHRICALGVLRPAPAAGARLTTKG